MGRKPQRGGGEQMTCNNFETDVSATGSPSLVLSLTPHDSPSVGGAKGRREQMFAVSAVRQHRGESSGRFCSRLGPASVLFHRLAVLVNGS